MDKIMSTRMDEHVIRRIGILAKKLGISKKAILEDAVRCYSDKIASDQGLDPLADSFGIWQREESAEQTVRKIKDSMRASQERYKR